MEEGNEGAKVNVLVTGGTGFFGHNLILALLADKRIGMIHVFARNPPPTEAKLSGIVVHNDDITFQVGNVWKKRNANAVFSDERVKVFLGDIASSVLTLTEAMVGCSIVFHACGDTRWWDAINKEQYRTNADGTLMVLNIARGLTKFVKRIVYTSTVDVMGHSSHAGGKLHGVLDEHWNCDDNYSFGDFGYNYGDSKRAAETRIRMDAKVGGGPETIVIRAGSMIGPWDVTDKYGRLFKELKGKAVPGIPCGGTSVCHVEDVAKAHIAAAFMSSERLAESGNIFICAGSNMTYRNLFHAMGRKVNIGKTIGLLGSCGLETIPRWALVAYGWGCEKWSNHVSGKEPEINPGMARYMSCEAYYDSNRAHKYLGYPSRDQLEIRWLEAIDDSHEWYHVRGRI
jgi:nucleoside-diphosphate-sugar epimerase